MAVQEQQRTLYTLFPYDFLYMYAFSDCRASCMVSNSTRSGVGVKIYCNLKRVRSQIAIKYTVSILLKDTLSWYTRFSYVAPLVDEKTLRDLKKGVNDGVPGFYRIPYSEWGRL